jgi:hypothetical protein
MNYLQTNRNPNWQNERTMPESTLANIPESIGDLCTICGARILDGEPVHMSWNGDAISHIHCSHMDK